MSNQSYYKDRLGFDPNEASLYDGSSGGVDARSPVKGDRYTSTPVRQAQKHHYGNGNGTPDRYQSPARGGYDSHEGTPSKKPKQQQQQQQQQSFGNNSSYLSESQNQSVYEESLTQFKGTMSLWEHFVDNWDILGTTKDQRFAKSRPGVQRFASWRPWSFACLRLPAGELSVEFAIYTHCVGEI